MSQASYIRASTNDDHSSEDDVIMDNIGQDCVCAIVFSAEAGMRATNLIREIPIKDTHIREYRIQDTSHLNTIPKCQAYLMFVDYNQDEVILEQDTATHGFLRLSSVRHLQARKGSEMALVYFDDSGKVPPSGQLFSPTLTNIDHPIVADLAHRRRFLSVRHKWNSEQADSLKTWLPVNALDKDRMAIQIDSNIQTSIRYRRQKFGYLAAMTIISMAIVGLVIFLIVYYT